MKCERPVEPHTWLNRPWFQTDPCGIEAPSVAGVSMSVASFQTDPCGIEALVDLPE